MSTSTIKKIIYDLDNETKLQKCKDGEIQKVHKEIGKYGRMLLSVLYKAHTDKFIEIFAESKEKVDTIYTGTVLLYAIYCCELFY